MTDEVNEQEEKSFLLKEGQLLEREARIKEAEERLNEQTARLQKQIEDVKQVSEEEKLAEVKKMRENTISSLEEVLMCPVCHDYFLEANTLACSHSFCFVCLQDWLAKTKDSPVCPVCRTVIHSEPILARNLNDLVDKLIASAVEEDQQEYKRRKDAKETAQKETCATLRQNIQTANTSNRRFLQINEVWQLREKELFESGLLYVLPFLDRVPLTC